MTDAKKATAKRARTRVTAADVARLSGVSRATVSYVLNDVSGQTIPEPTRVRVREAALELGYVPSAAAASLRRGHSRIVILVTEPALSGFVTEPFLRAIADRLTESQLVPVSHQYTDDSSLRSLVNEIRPFGVLALGTLSAEVMSDIEGSGVPHVYSSAHGDPSFPRPWEEEIGQAQAELLIENGARHLVYASPGENHPRAVIARAREAGAKRAAELQGLLSPTPVDTSAGVADVADQLRSILTGPVSSVGVCAFDDEVAAVVLTALSSMAVPVPDAVQVVGVDDAPFAPFLSPALSTFALDAYATGRNVADRFLRPAPGVSESARTVSAHPRFVGRRSTLQHL